jgi:hypothetical protein
MSLINSHYQDFLLWEAFGKTIDTAFHEPGLVKSATNQGSAKRSGHGRVFSLLFDNVFDALKTRAFFLQDLAIPILLFIPYLVL